MIQFDDHNNTLRLNVNDLLPPIEARPLPVGSLLSARGRLGSELHAAYLRGRTGDGYRREVPVSLALERSGYRVTIDGRLDGMRETPGGAIVEEVKTLDSPVEDAGTVRLLPGHAEQCGFYCLILHRSGVRVAGGVVRYLALDGRDLGAFDAGFSPASYDRRLELRLAGIMDSHVEERRLADLRADYARTMAFPFEGAREGQAAMMRDVEAAAASGRRLLCSAPTGIGKTAAALFPGLRQALLHGWRLLFLTAKVSQQELALQTLRRMIRPGGPVCAMQLTSKERTCPMSEMQCVAGLCPYLTDFGPRFERSGLLDDLPPRGVLDGETIRRAAVKHALCPFEVSLELVRQASAVVCDYNYVFDPDVAIAPFVDDPERRHVVIVDEAHNLPARVAGYYSPEIDAAELRRLASACQREGDGPFPAAAEMLTSAAEHIEATFARLAEERGGGDNFVEEPDRRFLERLLGDIENWTAEYVLYLAANRGRTLELPRAAGRERRRIVDPLIEVFRGLRDFCRCGDFDPDLFAAIWRTGGRARMLCLDPAPFVRERAAGFRAAVFMSATLTPFEFHARMLGADGPDTATLDLPSPFPRGNRLFLAVDSVDTSYRLRSREAERIAGVIDRTVRLRPGNYLAFFPSFAFRDEVMAHLQPDSYRLLAQQPAMRTDAILRQLSDNLLDTVLLCAVQGGVFAEGVDYPGHLAIGAFIVSPALPAFTAEQELVREYFDRHLGAGFAYAYVHPGIQRTVQSGGRIIRTPTDTGFVMLLCRRFTQPMYRTKLPSYWQEELVTPDDPVAAVREFWKSVGVPAADPARADPDAPAADPPAKKRAARPRRR